MYSEKTRGMVKQSFLVSVGDNKLFRRAATLDSRSIRSWILKTLVTTAKRQIRNHERKTGE